MTVHSRTPTPTESDLMLKQRSLFCCLLALLVSCLTLPAHAADVFVEAESFPETGGWKLDTQFIHEMGSPYLMAHGLGTPVADAVTEIEVTEAGQYRVWARTIDWVARWGAKPSPGKFQIAIGDQTLPATFGTESAEWQWQDGGLIKLPAGKMQLSLHDLTGFNGRCDCIYLTTDADAKPPASTEVLSGWRRSQLGLADTPVQKGPYDLVVVGGGYSGMGAAISAARMGCKVALIQDRPVLGGNGSSEVRVWAMGHIRRGRYPRIGEIIDEFADKASKSPGTYEEFGDELKEALVRSELNIDLMLNHHAYAVTKSGSKIASVKAFDTRSGAQVQISGDRFADCTGHGWIGYWASADLEMSPKGRMGMSNMWRWDETDKTTEYPKTPWALDLDMTDFPYPRDHHGQWFWESGFDKDPVGGAESIRDWNLRAVFGAFNAMKNRDGASDHKNAVLSWVAYVGGPRESRRLMGDVVLTQDDVVNKQEFPDGCVPSTWSIDLHYPKEQYAAKFKDNPFISIAVHDRRIDRMYGYPVPYRCFYSRNIDNLFMAGRCISVTHQALGTVRVMKTCGMMGEVVGKAASICEANNCSPRDVYEAHLDELITLMKLPGKARRETVTSEITIPEDALPLAGPLGPASGIDIKKMKGIASDDVNAKFVGRWTGGTGLKKYVGSQYRYAGANSDATATFTLKVAKGGKYRIDLYSQPHENRATRTPVTVSYGDQSNTYRVNQRDAKDDEFIKLDTIEVADGSTVTVVLSTKDAGGTVHADAVRLLSVE